MSATCRLMASWVYDGRTSYTPRRHEGVWRWRHRGIRDLTVAAVDQGSVLHRGWQVAVVERIESKSAAKQTELCYVSCPGVECSKNERAPRGPSELLSSRNVGIL
jgi:hypothetical protein